MNPVIGLDISKGQSEGHAFLSKGQPYGRRFRFLHMLRKIAKIRSTISGKRGRYSDNNCLGSLNSAMLNGCQ